MTSGGTKVKETFEEGGLREWKFEDQPRFTRLTRLGLPQDPERIYWAQGSPGLPGESSGAAPVQAPPWPDRLPEVLFSSFFVTWDPFFADKK